MGFEFDSTPYRVDYGAFRVLVFVDFLKLLPLQPIEYLPSHPAL